MTHFLKRQKILQEVRGHGRRERKQNLKTRAFENYFENALNREECTINFKPAELVFQDHSQSNNKDLSDDKYIIAPNSTPIQVGDYIGWRDKDWLVFTEEHKTIPSHQQLKIKQVNQKINWILNGRIVTWGAYVQSQTLYTLGVNVTNKMQVVDSKMMFYIQNNEDTRQIKTGQRLFVGDRVYIAQFIDPVSRQGLISILLDEDTIGKYDNTVRRIADYYRYFDRENVVRDQPIVEAEKDDVKLPRKYQLAGDNRPRVGRTYKYDVPKNTMAVNWTVEHIEGGNAPYKIINKTKDYIVLEFENDARHIGKTVNVIAELESGNYAQSTLSIIKRY